MRILFIAPYIPSLVRVRPYNLIRYLVVGGHQVTLLALIPPGEDTASLNQLKTWCHQVKTVPLPRWRTLRNAVQVLPGRTPLQAAYSRSPQMEALIEQVMNQQAFDVVHVEHLRGAELVNGVSDGAPVVFDSVDSISLLFEKVLQSGPSLRSRLLAQLDLARTEWYEGRLTTRFAHVLVTSPQDRHALIELAANPQAAEKITVLPNGVDLEYFSPLTAPRKPDTIVFSGKMSYHANVAAATDLVTQVMPLIWQERPDTRLIIAGKDPTPALLKYGQDSRIEITGTVPDLRPYIGSATITVLPLRYGVGIQNKVLEAMAMATPVITTAATLKALQVTPGVDVLAADTPAEMARLALELFAEPQRQQALGEAGRRYVETYHNWTTVTTTLSEIYRRA
jgi:sugar transferase (PEP-CTERM/EpsH1 system associated)